MRERGRRSETFRAAAPLRAGPVAVLAIERVVLRSGRTFPAAWASAALEPHALVVREPGGVRVVALGADPVSLERLAEQVPGLDDLLASL